MGHYIQCKQHLNKAGQIVAEHGAVILANSNEAYKAFEQGKGIVCVVQNGMFDAAGFCYNQEELDLWADHNRRDYRPKTWLAMDRKKAEELSGYKG